MRIIIFGATGSIGRELVRQALDQGHTVTAFSRRPESVQVEHPSLQVYAGDVLDYAAVEQAIGGHDAVLCALGAGRKGVVRAEGTRHIIQAMEREGIDRLICQTTLGAGDSRENLNFFWKYLMFGLLLKQAMQDHELQEQYIRRSSLDWTIVRPAAFTDGPLTNLYQHGFGTNAAGLRLKISRADVAAFMLAQLTTATYLRKTPGLSY
ncbi:Flavin reductase FR [Fibrella aestuarina BUZ 2]|uniref:Flavin reductase FR n=1 Tax=Fibrella aestuarina BUZ 2 TaxID=1166018 RepID=I0KDU0_9BACT|nr:SDR family oxidoreductase [Fibrella aestuarina]CCH02293.1 Flavin reductase FR [Fibrella aestuarina BUZ 2]